MLVSFQTFSEFNWCSDMGVFLSVPVFLNPDTWRSISTSFLIPRRLSFPEPEASVATQQETPSAHLTPLWAQLWPADHDPQLAQLPRHHAQQFPLQLVYQRLLRSPLGWGHQVKTALNVLLFVIRILNGLISLYCVYLCGKCGWWRGKGSLIKDKWKL